MRTGQWRRSLTVLVTAAVLAGCTSADPQPNPTGTATTSSPATETPTPTNSPSDPYAVPDEITPEYVDLVVNKIYERHGELLRELLSRDPDPSAVMPVEMRENFAGIFDAQYLQQRLDEGDEVIQGEREFARAPSETTQLEVETVRIVAAANECIVAIARMDNSGVSTDGFVELVAIALESRSGPGSTNPTPWVIADVAPNRGPEGPNPDDVMLNASLEDLTAAAIGTSCTAEDERE